VEPQPLVHQLGQVTQDSPQTEAHDPPIDTGPPASGPVSFCKDCRVLGSRVGNAGGKSALAALGLLLLLLSFAHSARAELVGEFNARLKNVRTWGAYTAVLDTRIYETDGSPPPTLARAQVLFPKGASIRPRFLRNHFFCDPTRLALTRDTTFCERAHFGSGELLLDGRPAILDPVHVAVELYLGRTTDPKAVATIVALITSNERSHAYDFQVHLGPLYKERGRFGHRLDLPVTVTPVLPSVVLKLAEMSLTVRGLKQVSHERRCVRRALGSRGRCLARRTVARKVFWTRVPACRRARKVAFGADYAFEGRETIRKRRKISCKRFLRRPSAKRRGTIPGS
jgi:hypothetical protein